MVAALLGGPMLVFAINAAVALANQFVSGFIPGRWFSNNALDWMTSFGTVGGTSNYLTFMVNGMIAYLCWAVIVWALTGRRPDSSS